MLFRLDTNAVVAIPQPSHAWLSGQLARCWGNELFAPPRPFDEVCLGAEQHDIAWLRWEASPTLDGTTGLPHDFRQIDFETRVALWREGIGLALGFGLYPALLVSLHAQTIHSRCAMPSETSPNDVGRAAMRAFLAEQQAFRQEILEALASQPRYRDLATPEITERNRLLVYAVDRLSLEICWGVRDDVFVPGVSPDGRTKIHLHLHSRRGTPDDLVLDPWPFCTAKCEVVCEGRRFEERFVDPDRMRDALAAPRARVLVQATLRPR